MGRTILWLGDAGAATGFSRVTHSIGERLVEKGWDIHVLAFNWRGDYFPTTLKLYRPTIHDGNDIYGRTRMIELLLKVKPDVVVMMHDAHLLLQLLFENQFDPQNMFIRTRPIMTYVPVDGINLPPRWPALLSKYTNVVTMSEFGQAQYPGSKMVSHAVDTDLFWPVSAERPIRIEGMETLRSKRDCKKAFGFDPNGFLVLRVDKNSGRKDFAATWKALMPVMQRHPDIQVHFHCSAKNDANGITLNALFNRAEADGVARDRWFTPDEFNTFDGWPVSHLNALYNAADTFVSTSRGEGWGLTLGEALACGVPVIAQNVSAIPEVVGPGGILLEPQRLLTVPSGEDTWLADIDAFSAAIEKVYLSAGLRRDLGKAGREHITKFTWDFAAMKFDEYLSVLADRDAGTVTEDSSGPD
jgi:glycosyltransferase involved in cell wall biosynthesis